MNLKNSVKIIIEILSNDVETLSEYFHIIQCLVNIRKQFWDSGNKIKDNFLKFFFENI